MPTVRLWNHSLPNCTFISRTLKWLILALHLMRRIAKSFIHKLHLMQTAAKSLTTTLHLMQTTLQQFSFIHQSLAVAN